MICSSNACLTVFPGRWVWSGFGKIDMGAGARV